MKKQFECSTVKNVGGWEMWKMPSEVKLVFYLKVGRNSRSVP